jgi:oxygen-independent coproporphyrinogen-3 oxidase
VIQAMLREISQQKDFLNHESLHSIYFGGGTPSILTVADLSLLFDAIHRHFNTLPDAEITLEANPDDINPLNLKAWRQLGINRLSIGLQSFNDEELAWMNRAHRAAQNESSVKMAQDAGFENITVDLIYGSRFQNMPDWEKSLQKIIHLQCPHVSAYNLTIEGKTKLHQQLQRGKESEVDEQLSSAQFVLMNEMFEEAGIFAYEISNYAKKDREAVHNSNYWRQKPYLGIGPSAHSYRQNTRRWNVKSNALYIQQLQKELPHYETEELSTRDLYNEYVLTRLRTVWGIDEKDLLTRFGDTYLKHFVFGVKNYASHIDYKQGLYTLSASGRLLADKIASDLFML